MDDGTEGELLCNIMFSLAYGGLLLLNHTKLKLHRGHRYGICAGNGKGKSTLMKAIRDQKVRRSPFLPLIYPRLPLRLPRCGISRARG